MLPRSLRLRQFGVTTGLLRLVGRVHERSEMHRWSRRLNIAADVGQSTALSYHSPAKVAHWRWVAPLGANLMPHLNSICLSGWALRLPLGSSGERGTRTGRGQPTALLAAFAASLVHFAALMQPTRTASPSLVFPPGCPSSRIVAQLLAGEGFEPLSRRVFQVLVGQ